MIQTPDFASHEWHSIVAVTVEGPVLTAVWADGVRLEAFELWLYEQTVGIEPRTREGTIEPSSLPQANVLASATVSDDGSLSLTWIDGNVSRVHPGWLYSIAIDDHLPGSATAAASAWTTDDFDEPPTFDGTRVLDDDSVLEAWISSLCSSGIGRLSGAPKGDDFLAELAAQIGPVRGSNFGQIFTVESIVHPDSVANTGLELGQHTDLPTRETPPGFQLLHCVENTVSGGASRLTDGLAVIDEIKRHHPDAYASLTTDEWVFANRAVDGDHRWIGPIIDLGGPRAPLTIRAFYPVRLAPHMSIAKQPMAYQSMRVFSQVAHDPRFMISYHLEVGDVIGFDNRRVLHGRDAFDPTPRPSPPTRLLHRPR